MEFLSVKQIEEICDLIPLNKSIPKNVAESIRERIKTKLRNDLKKVQIYPEIFEKFKKEILHYYHKTMTCAGEAVGIITAQSIGERQTQTTLNSFHSAGLTIKTVVTGVPRFSELLNATKEPKMVNCLIYMNENFDGIQSIRKRIGNGFTEISLKRLSKNYEVMTGPLENWHTLFCELYDIDSTQLGKRIRFFIDLNVLYEYNVKMKDIKKAIESNHDMTVLYTPESKGIVDVFINNIYIDEEIDKENDKEIDEKEIDEKVDEKDKEPEDIDKDEMDKDEIENKNIEVIKEKFSKDDIPKDIEELIMIEDVLIPKLFDLNISGIKGIKEIFFEKRKYDKEEKWIITTEGSNLYGLFENPLVDKKNTLCNNMWEIYSVFGIEATRQFLIEEFMDVVTSDGTFVNSSHVELLVDLMVYTGTIISISRYGQKKIGSGPLSKASFEESLENFLKAALNSEKETTDGVSASIILGKMPKIGTGIFDLKIDLNKIIPPSVFKGEVKEKEVKEEIKEEIFQLKIEKPKKSKKMNSLFL